MKNILLISLLTLGLQANAQEAFKPRYNVQVFTADSTWGTFQIELFPLIAPNHTLNFDSLVRFKLYDSTAFHRVVPGFVVQGGDPNSRSKPRNTWGQGDPSQQRVDAEFSPINYARGILGAARTSDPNSATSQFFICVAPAPHLNGNYTVYGQQLNNFSLLDSIVSAPRDERDNPLEKISMIVEAAGFDTLLPPQVTLNQPENGASNIGSQRGLSYILQPNALLYYIEVATDSLFQDITHELITFRSSMIATNLSPASKYYWRVRSTDGGHFSPYSEVRYFTTNGYVGINEQKRSNIQLIQQDNQLIISGWNPTKTSSLYSIIDLQGKTITSGTISLQEKNAMIPINNLEKGMYFLEIKELQSVKKFMR